MADFTIICTEERKEQIHKSNPKKVIVIHNSPDVPAKEAVKEEYDYVYCGSLFSQRLLKEIFDQYEENSDIKFAIAGYGQYADIAKNLEQQYENYSYFGPVTYDRVLDLEMKSKVISAIYEPTVRNHRLCAPNKFYEALALAKPIIVCKGTGIDQIVKKHQIGRVIDYDAEEFYEALRDMIIDQGECMSMGLRSRELYEKEYRWEIMKQRLIEAYSQLEG